MSAKNTTDLDRAIAARIVVLRKSKGLSQTALGNALGVTFQQIQKYEKAQNRIGAGRLHSMAKLFDVPISAIYRDDSEPPEREDVFATLGLPGAIELVRAYGAIQDAQMRRDVLAIVKSAARLAAPPIVACTDRPATIRELEHADA